MSLVVFSPPLHHQVYTHEADDGTFRAWDATQGNEIASDGRSPTLFDLIEHGVTPDLVKKLYPDIDEDHAMTTDLDRPLLSIPFFGTILFIDGWHRLWKAAHLNVPQMLMYELTQAEADSILWMELPTGLGLPVP